MKYAVLTEHAKWWAAGLVVGSAYYWMMSVSVPKDSNCSFMATIWTDIFATLIGLVLMYRGVLANDIVVSTLGFAIVVEHFWQWFFNKKDKKD